MDLIKQYVETSRLVAHQIDAYNEMITRGLQAIVNREAAIESDSVRIKFGQIYVDKPKYIHTDRTICSLFPNEARKKNLNYDGTCYANVHVTYKDTNDEKTYVRVPIGKIPVMIGSNACNLTEQNKIESEECSNDPGGYFILKGVERTLVGQLRSAHNTVFVYAAKREEKFLYCAEMRSMNLAGTSVLIQAKIDSNNIVVLSLPYIKNLIPAGLIFKALDVSESDMMTFVRVTHDEIRDNLRAQYNSVDTSTEAIEFIANRLNNDQNSEYVKTILTNEIFYHVGKLTNVSVALHVGYILKHLIETAIGNRAVDVKDNNLATKRMETTDCLIEFLFQGLFKQFCKTISNQLKAKKNPDPITMIKSLNIITHGLNTCFMRDNWTMPQKTGSSSNYVRTGVSQVLSVQNYGARISHLRRIAVQTGMKCRKTKTRQIHASNFSFICPYETPEGTKVGLVNNLALTTEITFGIPGDEILRVVKTFSSFRTSYDRSIHVLLNGTVVGSVDDGYLFKKEFDTHRNAHAIDSTVSIAWISFMNEIRILSDCGRFIRPVFAVSSANAIYYETGASWKDALANNWIVFRDPCELEQCVVAMDREDLRRNRCDYMEICPAGTMMGVMASVIPFANHSQSPRNAYQASMGKQAIGIPCESFRYRYDTSLHVLDYAQKPIAGSAFINIVKFNEMSHGAIPVVAIMTHCGFNQEDSIIVNKASIERGLFSAHTYKTIQNEERKRSNSDFETICAPKYEYRKREYNYSYIDADGIVKNRPGLWLKQGDVIIGKTSNKMIKREADLGEAFVREINTVDDSVVIKSGEEGYLDSVLDTVNNEGVRIIKIRIRIPRYPEIGDKFASSTAQKGTCGMIYAQEDMPFDKDGICPDIIMNPHAIPSRMTINMLIEMCLNLIGCKTGRNYDATTFAHPDIEGELENLLKETGMTSYSSTLYSGFTGEQMPCKIFMAPAFYQRLKHMVSDKIHTRIAGPLDTLTHQPVAGRSRDGGFRFGEMERDCMLAHGASRIVKECLFDQSDKYKIRVCNECGNIPHVKTYCHICDNDDISLKNMPYATKLLYQELMGMGIKITIN